MIRRIFTAAKHHLLNVLPVAIARKHVQRAACSGSGSAPAVARIHKQLLVDVSVIINDDARTGIQRVVRALLLQLLKHPPSGWRVCPVFATRKHGYRHAPEGFSPLNAPALNLEGASPVKVEAGDLFLGLDLAAHLLPRKRAQLTQWKRAGVEVHIVVYDLLPVLHPHWFNAKTSRNFRRWLKTVATFADSVICISNTVKAELEDWLYRQYGLARGSIPSNTISLGADIEASAPSRGLPEDIAKLPETFINKTTVLMVGTLEPRKGHSKVLAAFEKLWHEGHDINLVFVGKPGWKTEALQQQLRTHRQNNNHLYWLENASDEVLEFLYLACTGVIVASKAEGFGLPLIEAMHYNKPVLARDIPVLREVGEDVVSFWSGSCAKSLKNDIEVWLEKIATEQVPQRGPSPTWRASGRELLNCLGLRSTLVEDVHHERAADAMAHEVMGYAFPADKSGTPDDGWRIGRQATGRFSKLDMANWR